MKLFCLAGGFLGFVLTFFAGLFAGGPIETVLRNSAIGCLAGAVLMRWLSQVLGRSLNEAVAERARQAASIAAAEEESRSG